MDCIFLAECLVGIWKSRTFAVENKKQTIATMKRFLMVLVCLMTMCVSAMGQDDIYIKRWSHSRKEYRDTRSYGYKDRVTFMDMFPVFGIGGGILSSNLGERRNSFNFYIIGGGVYLSLTWADADTESDVAMMFCEQVGYFFPIVRFNKKTSAHHGWGNSLLISPIIEMSHITHFDGEYMHHTPGHHCTWWVDKSYDTNKKIGYGVALMYRHNWLSIMATMTNKSCGVNIGLFV